MNACRAAIAMVLALALLPGDGRGAAAQNYPVRAIKLVVPFPAGGANDAAARVVSTALASVLGQPVIVENQAGAGGTIAARQVAHAAPDGYTLLMVVPTNIFGTAQYMYQLDFDPAKSLAPVGLVAADQQVMVAGPSVPVTRIDSLVQHAQANPGKLIYGAAFGIAPHLLMELFKRRTGAEITYVPYRGGAPVIADLLGGHIDLTINGKSVLLPHIIAGRLKPLAVTSAERWPELPEVPTLLETGSADWPYETLFGVVVPAGTPVAIIERLNRAINEALGREDIRMGLAKLGLEPRNATRAEFAQIIAGEGARWARLVTIIGIKPN